MADYLKSRKGRKGWFFQRSVPPDCRDVIGKATWIRKAGDTLTEAKRNAAVFLEESEQLIREARGKQLSPTQKLVSLISHVAEAPADPDAHDLVQGITREPMHLDDEGTINPKYEELQGIAQDVLKGTAKPLTRPEELLTRARLLKDPQPALRTNGSVT